MAKLTYTAVYAILEREGKIYLMQRANSGYYDGAYALPSGHLEEDENIEEATIREVAEETGLVITSAQLTLAHGVFYMGQGNSRVYNDYFFRVTGWQGEPHLTEPEKCTSTGWFAWDNLPTNMPPEVTHALTHICQGGPQISQLDLRA